MGAESIYCGWRKWAKS